MTRISGLIAAALIALSLSARAQVVSHDADELMPPRKVPAQLEKPDERQPWPLRLLMSPLKRGMFIRLPVIDTDPNRGVTYGIMPIWVLQDAGTDRIRSIHAPSLTYNKTFKATPTYRYYLYPTDKSSYEFRASVSQVEDREIWGSIEDEDFLGRGWVVHGEIQHNVDGSGRFFGLGSNSAKSSETGFTRKTTEYAWRIGLPIFKGSGARFNFGHRLAGERIAAGPIASLPSITSRFRRVPSHWNQDGELQLFMDYDTRDSAVTTTRGSYAKAAIENSQKAWGSEYAFQRYEIDLRHFHRSTRDARLGTAGRLVYRHLVGDVPFYLKPALGGKHTHRAYGDGRYIDHALLTASLEERITLYKIPLAGVVTEFEVAPFFELGSVANSPHRFAARYARPVVGTAFRAVARPQVVGSIDVGVGQEGAAVFMDINYSF